MRLLSIIFFLAIFSFSSTAQTRFESDDPVNQLLDTEFMRKFMDMKVAAESSARSFKSQQEMYTPRDKSKIRSAYDRTAEKFNFVLRGIKEDLLDKKKLKYIERYPDDYAKELELDMYKLSDFYANNYQQVLADVTNNQIDGVAVLGLIAGILDASYNIFGLVKNISNFIGKNKARKQYFNEQRLEKVLIKPHLWTAWDKLDGQNDGGFEQPDNTAQNISTMYQEQETQFNGNYSSSALQTQSQQQSKAQRAAADAEARKNAVIANAQADSIQSGAFKVQNPNGDNGFNDFPQPFPSDESFPIDQSFDNEGLDANGNPLPPSEGLDANGNPLPPSVDPSTGRATTAPSSGTINIAIPKKTTTTKKINN